MRVKLEILKMNKDVIHDKELLYDGAIPLPLVGEDIAIGIERWTVKVREFAVLEDGFKICLWCEGPKDLLDGKY